MSSTVPSTLIAPSTPWVFPVMVELTNVAASRSETAVATRSAPPICTAPPESADVLSWKVEPETSSVVLLPKAPIPPPQPPSLPLNVESVTVTAELASSRSRAPAPSPSAVFPVKVEPVTVRT